MPETWSAEEYRVYQNTGRKPARYQTAVSAADGQPDFGDELKTANAFEAINAPVSIRIFSRRKRLCDTDGAWAKWIIDGIVAAGILKDDSPEYIERVTYERPQKAETEETEIEITWPV